MKGMGKIGLMGLIILGLIVQSMSSNVGIALESCSGSDTNFVSNGDFEIGGTDWTYWGLSGYSAGFYNEFANISGNDDPGYAWIYQDIDLSSWDGTSIVLDFRFNATSDYGDQHTNMYVRMVPLTDDCNSGSAYYSDSYTDPGGAHDISWRTHNADVTTELSGMTEAKLCIGLRDYQSADRKQHDWYDNVSLCGPEVTLPSCDTDCTTSPNYPCDCGGTTCSSGQYCDGSSCYDSQSDCSCGDGTCQSWEDCSNCEADCGECPAGCTAGSDCDFMFRPSSDRNIVKCALYTDISGEWKEEVEDTSINEGESNTITLSIPAGTSTGTYEWNINCTDDLGNSISALENFEFGVTT